MIGLLQMAIPVVLVAAPSEPTAVPVGEVRPPAAQRDPSAVEALHPPILLLDRQGEPVLQSGRPISTMRSCASCHDTRYIAEHSYHVWLGRDERFTLGSMPGRRAWDYSPGAFGRWNPIGYRYLSPPGDAHLDLGVAEWIRRSGWRHVGGGPAVFGHGELPLDSPAHDTRESTGPNHSIQPAAAEASGAEPNRQVLDLQSRQAVDWDWQASGVVEMNCFLCHVQDPDNAARKAMLASGQFAWANTATLASTGVVLREGDRWRYSADALRPDGSVSPGTLRLQEPTSENCGLCHGQTHETDEPLLLQLDATQWSTVTKGQVFSRQRMSDSAANLADKQQLARPWDVHAAALLKCSSCHFSLNNPAAYEPTRRGRPEHLRFEPRRLAIHEYLHRPRHNFAKGHTAQGTVARHLDGTMRRCDDCHQAELTHEWLPYREAHFARLSCEACHIEKAHAPALAEVDWTMLDRAGQARAVWRGIEGDPQDPDAPVPGFRPVLLPREDLDGQQRLVPHNLVTAWFWVEPGGDGASPRPVRLADLKAALLQGEGYHPAILAALDTDGDGRLAPGERTLDEPQKVQAVRARLVAVGVREPEIRAEIQPYGLHHGVGPAATALRSCERCHQQDSRVSEPMVLARRVPGGVIPAPVGDSRVHLAGRIERRTGGGLTYRPETSEASLYVLGHDDWPWVNWLGLLSVGAVIVGAAVHGALRIRHARRSGTDGGAAARGDSPGSGGMGSRSATHASPSHEQGDETR